MSNVRLSANSLVINATGVDSSIPPGSISASGTITGGNLVTSGIVKATSIVANVVGATVTTTANVQGGNLRTTGLISATGIITGGNLTTTGNINSDNTIFGRNVSLTGSLSIPQGNITANILSVNTFTYANVSTTGNVNGANFISTGNITSTGYASIGGNVIGGNIGTGGNITATGRVTAGSFIGNGGQLTGINGPAFIATITSSTSIPASPNTPIAQLPITFNSVSKNIGNGYSAGVFTAPTAGFYQVSAAFAPGVPAPPANPSLYYGAGALGIYKNGLPVASGPFIEAKSRSWGAITVWVLDASSVSTLIYLNIGDTLQCKLAYITNYSGFTTLPNIVAPYFQACWLRS